MSTPVEPAEVSKLPNLTTTVVSPVFPVIARSTSCLKLLVDSLVAESKSTVVKFT